MTSDPAEEVVLDLPATHKHLGVASACLAEYLSRVDGVQDAPTTVYNLQLAVQEVCANVVDHAYDGQPAGRIHLTLRLLARPLRLRVEVADTGRAFDPAELTEPDLDQPQEGGYGLFLVRSLVDGLVYEQTAGVNRWLLTKIL